MKLTVAQIPEQQPSRPLKNSISGPRWSPGRFPAMPATETYVPALVLPVAEEKLFSQLVAYVDPGVRSAFISS